MKTRHQIADADVRAKSVTASDDAPVVMMTRAQLSELVADAVISALAEFEAAKPSVAALLTCQEMADKLKVSRSKLHEMRAAGLPAVQVGSIYKYELEPVMRYLREKSAK